MPSASEFKTFNSIVNPNNDAIYLVLSRTTSGKGVPLTFGQVLSIMGTDQLAEIGFFLPADICCIEVDDQYVVGQIALTNQPLIITRIGTKFQIYARDPSVRQTTNNSLVCGIAANTYASSKAATALLLPFKSSMNTAVRLRDAELVYMTSGSNLGELPILLKPINKISKPAPDYDISYPLSTDVANILLTIYRNMNKAGFGNVGKLNVIKELNRHYVTSPFTDDELANILNENLLSKEVSEFYVKDQFMHNRMGDYLAADLHIKRDATSRLLYYYDDRTNIYRSDDDILFGIMTRLCPSIKKHQRQEVLDYLSSKLALNTTVFNNEPYHVVFKNGLLDVESMKFKPMSPEYLETIQLNCDYNPKAKSPIADKFFADVTCGDKSVETLLYEAIGYSMLKTNEMQKAFLLVGSGRNGKSTYFDVIKQVLGRQNTTAISFKDLAGTFRASALDGKLASLAGDISSQPITESDLFKSITSGEDVLIEKKYEHAYERQLYSTMFFSANALPRTPDTSEGFFRRFCIIPFNADLSKVKMVDGALFHKKLMEKDAIEYIAAKAVAAIHKVLTQTFEFTQSAIVDDAIRKYKIANSSVLSWYYDELEGDINKIVNTKTYRDLYDDYKNWCGKNGFGVCKSSNFCDQLKAHLDLAINERDKFVDKKLSIFDLTPVDEEDLPDELPFEIEQEEISDYVDNDED